MKTNINIIFFVVIILYGGCKNDTREIHSDTNKPERYYEDSSFHLNVTHAKNFTVKYEQDAKIVTVTNPWKNTDQEFKYVLLPKSAAIPDNYQESRIIRTPISEVVCFSTTHIPFLDLLGQSEKLIGFANTKYVSSNSVRTLIDSGLVTDVGSASNPNLELLVSLNPDIVMAFGMQNNEHFKKIQLADIPVVYNADYMELSPLGRAEWIKFTSLFFNQEQKADSIFNEIAIRYDSLQSLAASAGNTPTVFSGIVYGDTWFLPGGENYAARFFSDANANYLWQQNSETGYLELSFEKVYEQAHQADFWIGVGDYHTLAELRNTDHRYANFQPFKSARVYNYNAKIGAKGGNEYFELGYARPDLILADLIKIFHPELLPEYDLYFHKQLTRDNQ